MQGPKTVNDVLLSRIDTIWPPMVKKPTFHYEKLAARQGYDLVIGVDEVGRGALAGPVIAGAVFLKKNSSSKRTVLREEESFWLDLGVDDSKRLTVEKRGELDKIIREEARWGIGEVGVATINRIGIVKATEKAMRQAIRDLRDKIYDSRILNRESVFVLVDAFHVKYITGVGLSNQKAVVKGDQKVLSIAAASIIAKVHRDKVMRSLSRKSKYKKYHWDENKGYGTGDHIKAIKKHGLTRFHRALFVRKLIV